MRHEYAAASRSRRLTSASALFSASARCLAMFRVPASAPVERDLAAAVPETRPLEPDAVPFDEVERAGEAEAAVLFAGPGESVDSEPPPRRGRRGRLFTWAPPHSPLASPARTAPTVSKHVSGPALFKPRASRAGRPAP